MGGTAINKKKKGGLIFVMAAVLILLVGGGGFMYAGTNNFCGSCHQMKTRYAIWSKSTHNKVDCITCHSEPGFIGEVIAHVKGVRYLKSFVKGETTNITIFAEADNPARLKSCIYCHPVDKIKDETEDIFINHDMHVVRNNVQCTACHIDIVHGNHKSMKVTPLEATCVACHIQAGARTDCQSCHIKRVLVRNRQHFLLEALEE